MNINEQLESRKLEIQKAFETVLEVIDLFVEMGEVPPPAVYSYLWKKKFKLEGITFEEEEYAV